MQELVPLLGEVGDRERDKAALARPTARFSGKVISATKMSGTVTGTSDKPRQWSAEKKK